jgi:hypothetical protein
MLSLLTILTKALSVVNGSSGEYNATATLTPSTNTLSFSLENGFQFSESNKRSIPGLDIDGDRAHMRIRYRLENTI